MGTRKVKTLKNNLKNRQNIRIQKDFPIEDIDINEE